MRPGEPAFLDTLGRCYYAAGEYQNAVKYQRQAVAKEPHLQVMRRQLETFERALATQGNGEEATAETAVQPSAELTPSSAEQLDPGREQLPLEQGDAATTEASDDEVQR